MIWKDIGPSDAGIVIDGEVNEVPTALAAALTAAPAGNAMADRIEASELFDVEMDDLTGRGALVNGRGCSGSRAESKPSLQRLRMRETVDVEMRTCAAICAWVWR